MGEVITGIIPRQRIDRVERLTTELAAQVSGMDEERVRQRFGEPGFVDLLEDGLGQTIRATSKERIKQIATLLKNGLSDDDVNALQYKTLMGLLGQLNDAEIIILQYEGAYYFPVGTAFFQQHQNVLTPPIALTSSPQSEHEKEAIHNAYYEHLERLGLYKGASNNSSNHASLDIDAITGMIKPSFEGVTNLGLYLLRVINSEESKPQDAE